LNLTFRPLSEAFIRRSWYWYWVPASRSWYWYWVPASSDESLW